MKKLFLLFVSIYFLVYILPFPLSLFGLSNWYYSFCQMVTVKFGKSILNLQHLERIQVTGSGDTTLHYVGTLINLIFTIVTSLLLWILLRSKISSSKLLMLVGIYARYYLAYCCISYGFAKVLVSQFPVLSYYRLAEAYGDSTPMGLFWTFMSASPPYTMFCGWLEVIAGYLILFRNTKTIGGLLTIILMTQVVMINLCYDVPVKLFSLHLLLMSFFILGSDIRKMFRFFLLRQSVQLSERTVFKNRKWRHVILVLQCSALIIMSYLSVKFTDSHSDPSSMEQFFGVYQRQKFEFDKGDAAAIANPGWQEMIIEKRYDDIIVARVKMPDRTSYLYTVNIDTIGKKMEFIGMDSRDPGIKLQYTNPSDTFYVTGSWANQNFNAVFIKRSRSSYNLINTGFHWIQEKPNNK